MSEYETTQQDKTTVRKYTLRKVTGGRRCGRLASYGVLRSDVSGRTITREAGSVRLAVPTTSGDVYEVATYCVQHGDQLRWEVWETVPGVGSVKRAEWSQTVERGE